MYASIEAETAEMDPAEARALLDEFGGHEPGLETVIRRAYRAIDLITFLTTGDDETRAWEVRSGAKAHRGAGVIHTDLERGFIRAEVIASTSGSRPARWTPPRVGQGPRRGQGYEVREARTSPSASPSEDASVLARLPS